MTRSERRLAARDAMLDDLERHFYDRAAEIALFIESGDADRDLTAGTPLAVQLLVQPSHGAWMAQ